MNGISIYSPKQDLPYSQRYERVIDDFGKIRIAIKRKFPDCKVCEGIEPRDHLPSIEQSKRTKEDVECMFEELKIDYPLNPYDNRTIWVDKDAMKVWVIYFDKWRRDPKYPKVNDSPLEAHKHGNAIGDMIAINGRFWSWKVAGTKHYYRECKIMIYSYNYGDYVLESEKNIRNTYKKDILGWVGPQ